MAGLIMDGVLMALLVLALGYGFKLERKLKALREGQVAFASAVGELNQAAGRAESAFATLRAAGQETDLLHDRILKAREVKAQLEQLMARGSGSLAEAAPRPTPAAAPPAQPREAEDDERARRMAVLADRIQGLGAPAERAAPGRDNVAAIVQALSAGRAANQTAQRSLNAARRNLDEDLFAA